MLKREQVLCPMVYAYRKFGVSHASPDMETPYHWTSSTAANILENELYPGNTMSASYNHFTCCTYKKESAEVCTAHYIRECILDEVVLEALRRVTAQAREHTQEFAVYISGRRSAEVQWDIRRRTKDLEDLQKRARELDVIFKRLYEGSALGRITTGKS